MSEQLAGKGSAPTFNAGTTAGESSLSDMAKSATGAATEKFQEAKEKIGEVTKDVSKSVIARTEQAGQLTTVLGQRVQELHGKAGKITEGYKKGILALQGQTLQGGREGLTMPYPKKTITRDEVNKALDKERIKKPKKGFWAETALRIGIAVATVGGGVAGYEAYQHDMIPGIHRSAETLIADSFFDNTASKGVIGEATITRMSQAEIDKLFPTAFGKLDDGKNTLQMEFPLDLSASANPTANLSFGKDFGVTGLFDEYSAFEEKGYYSAIGFKNVPGSTTINSPVDGMLTLSRSEDVQKPDNGSDFDIADIDFTDPNGNLYKIIINGDYSTKVGREAFIFKSLTSLSLPIKKTIDNGKLISSESNPIEIKKGEPIMKVIESQGSPIHVNFGLAIARESKTNKPIPANLELFTTQDNKLVAPSGK